MSPELNDDLIRRFQILDSEPSIVRFWVLHDCKNKIYVLHHPRWCEIDEDTKIFGYHEYLTKLEEKVKSTPNMQWEDIFVDFPSFEQDVLAIENVDNITSMVLYYLQDPLWIWKDMDKLSDKYHQHVSTGKNYSHITHNGV